MPAWRGRKEEKEQRSGREWEGVGEWGGVKWKSTRKGLMDHRRERNGSSRDRSTGLRVFFTGNMNLGSSLAVEGSRSQLAVLLVSRTLFTVYKFHTAQLKRSFKVKI